MEYTFTLKYRIEASDGASTDLVEPLGEAGCNDALVGIGRPGRLALEFTREAESAQHAIRSALADVRRALPAARLIEAAPDFAGLTDVAEFVGVSRQNVRKLMLSHGASFPEPVHEGVASIWHLADVLAWLERYAGYEIDPVLLETARAALDVNRAREARRLPRKTAKELEPLIA